VLGSMCVWDCGDELHVVGLYVSCEAGGVFPIGEYEDVWLGLLFLWIWAL